MPISSKYKEEIKYEIAGIAMLAITMLTLISIFNPAVGLLGKLINGLLLKATGEGRYIVPIYLGILSLKLLLRKEKLKGHFNIQGASLIAVVTLTLLHFTVPRDYIIHGGLMGDGGGIIGAVVYYLLWKSFGVFGMYVVLGALFLVGLLLITNQSIMVLFKVALVKIIALVKKTVRLADSFLFTFDKDDKYDNDKKTTNHFDSKGIDDADEGDMLDLGHVIEDDEIVELENGFNRNKGGNIVFYRPSRNYSTEQGKPGDNLAQEAVGVAPMIQQPGESANVIFRDEHILPPLSLLAKPQRGRTSKNNRDIADNVKKLEQTLSSFGIKARVTQVSRGPAITRYEVQPPPGVKVSRIVSLADDIALSMASSDVRIEAPVPGKAVVGIEIPNKEISMVYLRDLVETSEFQSMPSHLTVALGKDIAGVPVVDDLARMPHLLIAGATGAGKSVCLNTILAGILFKSTPLQIKFLIIDPKMVELSVFNGIPHLVSPVVTDPKKAATSLRWAVKEMEYRYELFAKAGVRDIARYNKMMQEHGNAALPLLVVVIDELADLMMVAPADVEDAICRLAQMARAAGIHLVVATQRPSVDIITGLIKANIPSRISFAVSSQIDSRTILDMGGAEKLLGRGDMLFYPVGASKPIRVQGAYLSDREVELVVQHWKKQAAPKYDEELGRNVKEAIVAAESEDELLPQSLKIFIETGHASISLLQRRLHIGYARAARLIDIMEKKGYVGGYEGSRPRSVLITRDEYNRQFFNDATPRAGND